MSQKTPPKAKTATPLPNAETASFEELWQRFQKSGCEKESFALAVYLYDRFPDESQKLLPKIKGEDVKNIKGEDVKGLGANDKKDDKATSEATPEATSEATNATTHEWAAALTAAKKIKNSFDKGLAAGKKTKKEDGKEPKEIKDVTEPEVRAQAKEIYARAKENEKACRAL